MNKNMEKTIIPFLFFQIQALGPFLGARSRDLLQIPPIESSVRFNLTDFVTKEGSVVGSRMWFFTTHLYLLPPLPSKTSPPDRWETLFTLCFYTKSNYPICPVVTFRDIVWEQGQKAGRHKNKKPISKVQLGENWKKLNWSWVPINDW